MHKLTEGTIRGAVKAKIKPSSTGVKPTGAPPSPTPSKCVADKPPVLAAIEALDKSRSMIKFHVGGGACIDMDGELTNATDLYSDMIKAHADLQKWVDDVPNIDHASQAAHDYSSCKQLKHLLKGVSDEM